jgi:hypothetical protein
MSDATLRVFSKWHQLLITANEGDAENMALMLM